MIGYLRTVVITSGVAWHRNCCIVCRLSRIKLPDWLPERAAVSTSLQLSSTYTGYLLTPTLMSKQRPRSTRHHLARHQVTCVAYLYYTFHRWRWGQLIRSFWWFLEPSSAQLEIEHFVFMLRRCGIDTPFCTSLSSFRISLKTYFSSTLTIPSEVCHIAIESSHSGHYLLCTANLSIFK